MIFKYITAIAFLLHSSNCVTIAVQNKGNKYAKNNNYRLSSITEPKLIKDQNTTNMISNHTEGTDVSKDKDELDENKYKT